MDAEAANALAQAIQALAAAIPGPPPAAAAAPDMVSPYEGGTLDLTSRTGTGLFRAGCDPLDSKFTGKVEDLHLFLADLRTRVETCHWNSATHGILDVAVGGTTFKLLDDYGKVTEAQVEAARITRSTASHRTKQNAQMMYECLMASITDEAKSALASRGDVDFNNDGPKLFYHLVSELFTATFSNAQATRDKLSEFHPRRFKYDVTQVNNFIRSAIKTLKAASATGGSITDQEILYFQFKAYKKIKAPAEWTSHILFLEAKASSTPTYAPDTLYNEAQAKYNNLVNSGLWKPSDKTPEEQTLAMVAQQSNKSSSGTKSNKRKAESKTSDGDKDKKQPPFAHKDGKLGDSKEWNGKTYYWCPANHKYSHWHTHKVEDCNTYKKMKAGGSGKKKEAPKKQIGSGVAAEVAVDVDKLKKGMAAILPGGEFDTDDLADALAAIIKNGSE